MSFLRDFVFFNEGNECPREFLQWSGLAALSTMTNPGVFVRRGYFIFKPNLFICLIGEQGDGKTTAKDIAAKLIMKNFPTVPVFTAIITREAMVQYLGSDEATRAYGNSGTLTEYRPIGLFVNELKNFLSVNPTGMLDTLTDIYDREDFKVVTKNKGTDVVPNPYVVFIACETPDWIRWKMKDKVLTGGFARRVIYVHVIGNKKIIPEPYFLPEHEAAMNRCIAHLEVVRNLTGEFEWQADTKTFWDAWYHDTRKKSWSTSDPITRGFLKTMHVQVIKTAMLFALADYNPRLIITRDILDLAITSITDLIPNMGRLSEGVGLNPLAASTLHMIEYITQAGGQMPEKKLMQLMNRDMAPMQFHDSIRYLLDTEQLHRADAMIGGVQRSMLFTPARFRELKEQQNKPPQT
jgi:hypothetical protein